MSGTFASMRNAAKKHGATFSFDEWGIMAKDRHVLFETGGKDCAAMVRTLVGLGVLPEFMEEDNNVVKVLWEQVCVPFVVEGLRRKAANQSHQVCNELEGTCARLPFWLLRADASYASLSAALGKRSNSSWESKQGLLEDCG